MKCSEKSFWAVAWVSVIVLCFSSLALAQAQEKPASPQKTGDVRGQVQYCGLGGNAGIVVQIPGRSFLAELSASGNFVLNYVPVGSYSLKIEIPGHSSETIPGVSVADNTITDLGVLTICRDTDGDTYKEDVDCNDNNSSIFPGALEKCDGVDNNCDGTVDEGCDVCTDADHDGFFAQAGCLTIVDCDDSDALVRPNAAELCDGIDNNCNQQVDEGFDLSSDPSNCGTCGNICSFSHSTSTCVSGSCELGTCNPGFGNCDTIDSNGCETSLMTDPNNCGGCGHTCPYGIGCSQGTCSCGAEVCDGIDNDCDGQIDEDWPSLNNICYAGTGACRESGRIVCDPSNPYGVTCSAVAGTPQAEVCGDGIDNDCDGQTDEGCP